MQNTNVFKIPTNFFNDFVNFCGKLCHESKTYLIYKKGGL